jgi:Carboxypeptidase regulatory-like domain
MRHFRAIAVIAVLLFPAAGFATIFGSVRGVVHDPQHRPVQGARVTLKAQNLDWTQFQESNGSGGFDFNSVPIGNYTVAVSSKGFQQMQQDVIVQSDTSPVLHFELSLASTKETVSVSEIPVEATTDSVTPTVMLSRLDIQQTPGADRTNGLEMITDYVPAAYVTHDMLHMRGGHQVEWLIDGVPIPNTNIATNLGPQIDPKDIDYLEVQRGSPTMETALMGFSTSCRAPALSGITSAISSRASAISIRQTTKSVAEDTPSDLLTMPA